MATKAPITEALSNWQQRAATYNQLGIPKSAWYQLATQDIQNVANTGATPLSTTEVNAAMAAQYANHSLIGNPTHHPHGLLGDIGSIVTSIPKDIGGLITGFLPGMAHFAAHLPSELTDTFDLLSHLGDDAWLQAHGYDTGGIGADLRDLSRSPVLNLIPGLADVADLTSAKGRQFLLTHPVTATLDVAPLASPLGKLSEAALGPAEAGSAREALQAGNPYRAAARGTREALAKTPGLARTPLASQEFYQGIADRLGLSQAMRTIFRGHTVIGRQAAREVENVTQAIGDEILKMPAEEQGQFWLENYGLAPITDPRHHALFQRLYDVQANMTELGVERARATRGRDGLLVLPHGQGHMTFAADSDVARMQRVINKLQRSRTRSAKNIESLKRIVAKWSAYHPNRYVKGSITAGQRLAAAKTKLATEAFRYDRLGKMIDEAHNRRLDRIYKNGGPAAVHPRVTHDIREAAKVEATKQYQRYVQLNRAHTRRLNRPLSTLQDRQAHALQLLQRNLRSIDEADKFTQIQAALEGPYHTRPRKEGQTKAQFAKQQRTDVNAVQAKSRALYQSIRTDVVRNVLDLIHHGFDPVWVKHVDPGREPIDLHPNPLPDRVVDIKQFNDKVMNFAPQVQGIGIGLVAAAVEYWRGVATEQFIQKFVMNHLERASTLREQYMEIARQEARIHPHYSITGHAQRLMNEEWEVIRPESFGLRAWPAHGRFSNRDTLMVRHDFARTLRGMAPADKTTGLNRLRMNGAYDAALHVFRFSVLTGPRHLVHVGMGGFLSLFLREPVAAAYTLTHLHSLYRYVHDQESPVDITKHIYDFTTDQVLHTAIGAQHAHWLKRGWELTGQKLERRLGRIEESVSDMYRASVLLSHPGLDREEAIARANKVMVDLDDMAPWERTILKQVFPFYGFTRFLFRYLLTYPVDHPYRVAILTRFATQYQEEWNSLLPMKFMQTLFIGHPDAHGNIKSVDLRNLNPFRSFANDFTMVGFFQSLNPLLSAPFAARGFDTLTGVGPLYPSLEYNPNTGTLQAAPPTGRDELFNVLSQFIPEVGTLDHFLQITDRMKVLKRTNPAQYRSLLFSQLNLPGILSPPVTVNLPYIQERAEMDRYKAAQAAVSQLTRDQRGGAAATEQYNLVPYQGQYVDPRALVAYWESLQAKSPNIDPKALEAVRSRRTPQNPLELLQSLGGIPPAPSNLGE